MLERRGGGGKRGKCIKTDYIKSTSSWSYYFLEEYYGQVYAQMLLLRLENFLPTHTLISF